MRRNLPLVLTVVLLAGCLEGGKGKPIKRADPAASHYTTLGGGEVLVQIVDQFVAKAATAPELPEAVRDQFKGTDLGPWKKKLTERFGAVMGGPYRGGLEELAVVIKERGDLKHLKPEEVTALLGVWKKAMEEKDPEPKKPKTYEEVMEKLKPLPDLFAVKANKPEGE